MDHLCLENEGTIRSETARSARIEPFGKCFDIFALFIERLIKIEIRSELCLASILPVQFQRAIRQLAKSDGILWWVTTVDLPCAGHGGFDGC